MMALSSALPRVPPFCFPGHKNCFAATPAKAANATAAKSLWERLIYVAMREINVAFLESSVSLHMRPATTRIYSHLHRLTAFQRTRTIAMSTAKKAKLAPTVVAVVSPPDNVMLSAMPRDDPNFEFLVANDLDTFLKFPNIADVEATLWVPPGNPKVLIDLWPHVPLVKWSHGFFAGVDALKGFMEERLVGGNVPLSNGRGAFSDSLAEYIMAASLHFNKQIARCEQNRREKKWDKFVMNTMQGKTMGFVGFGHIGQCAAKTAKAAFGMKILALRRNTSKGDNYGGVADETFGPDEKLEVFKQSDFVVCVLPGTEQTKDFCSKEEFDAMKSSAVFISCGRGEHFTPLSKI
jgi:phosphoglycerate dehydrogenase-like enzyme